MDPEHIRELFAGFGPVDVRRMFSGAGVFADGVMIALVASGVLYLKADEQTIPSFEQEGLAPFSYATKGGRRTIMSYWRMPDRLYDDVDELAEWARTALAAAHRTSQGRRPASRGKRKPARKPGPRTVRKVRRPASA
jgi:DNA transformation protein and related proteins